MESPIKLSLSLYAITEHLATKSHLVQNFGGCKKF